MSDFLSLDITDGVATIVLDELAAPVNTVSPEWLDAMTAAFETVRAYPAVTGVIVTSGKADFMAGADLKLLDFPLYVGKSWTQETKLRRPSGVIVPYSSRVHNRPFKAAESVTAATSPASRATRRCSALILFFVTIVDHLFFVGCELLSLYRRAFSLST